MCRTHFRARERIVPQPPYLCLISSNAIVSLTTFNKNNKSALYYDVLTQTALIICKMGHLTLKLETINDKNKIDWH